MMRTLIRFLIFRISGRSIVCEDMYYKLIINNIKSLLNLLNTHRYGDMLFMVGILVIFVVEYKFLDHD